MFFIPKTITEPVVHRESDKKGAAGVERTRQPNASCWRNSFDEKCFALSKEIVAGIQQEGLAAMLWTGARRLARWEQPISLSVALLSSRNVIRKRITGHGMLQPRGYLHTLTKINSPGSVIAEQYLQGLVVPCTTRGTGEDGCKISSKMKNWRIRDVWDWLLLSVDDQGRRQSPSHTQGPRRSTTHLRAPLTASMGFPRLRPCFSFSPASKPLSQLS